MLDYMCYFSQTWCQTASLGVAGRHLQGGPKVHPTDTPDIVIRRLPLYLRALTALAQAGKTITSSQELGAQLDISPAQIRKDLSYFGEFGKQGMGYEIGFLTSQLKRILQVNRSWDIALVGAGDLGHALVSHVGFPRWNFNIAAIFDKDPERIGQKLGDLIIQDVATLQETISDKDIRFGIIAVPMREAQGVADELVKAGVQAILNYAPVTLNVPEHVRCHCMDPIASLRSMAYYL